MFVMNKNKVMRNYKVGDIVKVSLANDNECYDDFRHKALVVTNIATNENEHLGYDLSMNGMQLMDFETLDGEEIPVSLYEYEIERA